MQASESERRRKTRYQANRVNLVMVSSSRIFMLHVYHSNRLEALFILLCTLRESSTLADPLTPETILVANPGIGRWLNFRIADRSGIAANIEYVLPATFVWQLYRDCLPDVPDKSAYERNALRLRFLNQLDAISTASEKHWLPLQRYAASDDGGIGDTKRVQLATRVAGVFDQYLVYRPQMLLDWEQGSNKTPGDDPAQRWQPALWRRLVESVNEPHRAALWKQFCTLADQGAIDPQQLPPQLHLFNVGLLPPSTLDVLVRLANIEDSNSADGKDGSEDSGRVSLYFLNPSIDYWADLPDMRRAARERLKLGAGSEPLADDQTGNPLLSSMGSSGRTLMKLLGDRSDWVHDEQFFLPSASDNLLSAVQADLLHPYQLNENQSQSPDSDSAQTQTDSSIQLHQCYSPVREVQALHDHLLHCFNADSALTPSDVIVMVPDINRYAPVIEAVFGSVGSEPDNPSRMRQIPWSVADRALVEVSPVVACVQRLFELPGFEFEATAVLGFAAEPAIARRFGFDDNALKTISQWMSDAGIRRTLTGNAAVGGSPDGKQNKLLHDAAPALHSWDFGLRRLLLGRAMPAGSGAVGETLPCDQVDGQQAELLSQLLNLLHALAEIQVRLGEARTPSEWVDSINDIITRLLLPDEDEADALAQFREMLTELDTDATSAGHTDAMTHATFAEIFRSALAGAQRKSHRYLTGRVTFSSMVPLRSVPFRIVCMLGLNDSDFPRQRPNPGFDLIAQNPQIGDRSVRDDDRYLFLEALLSARDELYLSWIYRNPSDNAARQPSVLVSELRDYLNKRHPDQPVLNIEHPLQPFSVSLFDPAQPDKHTFASEWAPPAEIPAVVSLTETATASTPDAQISLDDFLRFWRNPSEWYCRRVLRVALWRDEVTPEDAEPFESNALINYQLRSDLIDTLLGTPDVDPQAEHARLIRHGALPHGGLGELAFNTVFVEAQLLAERIYVHQATPLPTCDIDIRSDNQQLVGRMQNRVNWSDGSSGILHHRAANLKGQQVCGLWLTHLIASAAGVINGKSLLVAKDKDRALPTIDQQAALDKLQRWFAGWNLGQTMALPFFPGTSAALAGAHGGNAGAIWVSQFGGPGESEHEAVQLLYPNIAEVIERQDVLDWANQLLGDEALKS